MHRLRVSVLQAPSIQPANLIKVWVTVHDKKSHLFVYLLLHLTCEEKYLVSATVEHLEAGTGYIVTIRILPLRSLDFAADRVKDVEVVITMPLVIGAVRVSLPKADHSHFMLFIVGGAVNHLFVDFGPAKLLQVCSFGIVALSCCFLSKFLLSHMRVVFRCAPELIPELSAYL